MGSNDLGVNLAWVILDDEVSFLLVVEKDNYRVHFYGSYCMWRQSGTVDCDVCNMLNVLDW